MFGTKNNNNLQSGIIINNENIVLDRFTLIFDMIKTFFQKKMTILKNN
jgi:hypothetical protein